MAVTGFEKNKKIWDYIYLENDEFSMSNNKISKQNHGSGCNYSASMILAYNKRK